ncbi:ExeM/NucH family extracellular endonuclease [Duganella aceris]|uniref:ExeM/NucH family extracellular endonuclease n=1 Tax=Duganella aceris TaxID=2703883 RepID=A0ABX0FTJ3_9BURK|nr:ExeM/NucH family extracellular endonuclease [Duganella aceris]NGZ88017.1 ExeM/NucH family extracellular endonuclease [Duganella aceris]
MKKIALLPTAQAAATPGRRTVLAAALMAALCAPAYAADSAIVISQVYGGGGNAGASFSNDFVELFNRSASTVDLSKWSVQYGSATGTTPWLVTKLGEGVTLAPGKYLLVQQAAGTTPGAPALPTPEVTGTTNMSGTTGKVALVSSESALSGAVAANSATVVDLLGFGPTANSFEGAATAVLSNSTAALRKGGGCTDTDVNSADFAIGTPVPRNGGTTANVCAVAVAAIVPTCQPTLTVNQGTGGSAALSATDADGVVNAATITSTGVTGISLANFLAASAAGGVANVSLNVGGNVAVGTYPVVINFSNNQAEQKSCSVSVVVKGEAALTHTIPQIQGAGAASPYANTEQSTEGVVTLKVGSGFFIQDENGDGNPETSDGLFVYTTAAYADSVEIGDKILITGTVSEYTPSTAPRSYTELTNVSGVRKLSSGHVVTATNIAFPVTDFGRYEGMLVRFTSPLTVSQVEFLGERGEMTLSTGRLEVPTNRHPAGSPEAIALALSNAQNQIILDDDIFVTPATVPYLDDNGVRRAGDSVSDVVGVIDYGSAGSGPAFKLQPTAAPTFSSDNARTPAPVITADTANVDGNIKIASANVLNYFTEFTNGTNAEGQTIAGCKLGAGTASPSNCRGADNIAEFQRQENKIVNELKAINADVVGLMEIQNNGGDVEKSVKYLVKSLNAAYGAITYAYVPAPVSATSTPGTGTDAIRVAMIYKPSAVSLVGSSMSDTDAVNNRPPMAQTFRAANGQKFSVVVNHLKSKGSCPAASNINGDKNDGQGCFNSDRKNQATRLVGTFVPQVVAAASDPKVLLIGDFNSHGFEDPINLITAAGFVNQLERFVRPRGTPYSYVFDGESGYLDHALASAELNAVVHDAAEWHINADESSIIDYNLNLGSTKVAKPQDLYTAMPYRASDHDPVVITLSLKASYTDVTASVRTLGSGLALNRLTGRYTGTLTVTNSGAGAITGPLQVALNGLAGGITLVNATSTQNGAPYITVPGGLAPGASVTLPLTFSKTGTANISYTAKIYSGTF